MKRVSVAGIGVFVLVVFAAFTSGATKDAAKLAQTVLVGNTNDNPVPTTARGTTLVYGAVTLREGSTVGIDPSANTVRIGNPVQLANSADDPIFVQAAGASRPTPFQQTVSIHANVGGVGSAEFMVPASGTLVVENVSAEATEQSAAIGIIETTVNGIVAQHFLRPFDRPVTTLNYWRALTMSENRRFYADAGSMVRVSFKMLSPSCCGESDYTVTISGFIE
jgi:hypothetical protein